MKNMIEPGLDQRVLLEVPFMHVDRSQHYSVGNSIRGDHMALLLAAEPIP